MRAPARPYGRCSHCCQPTHGSQGAGASPIEGLRWLTWACWVPRGCPGANRASAHLTSSLYLHSEAWPGSARARGSCTGPSCPSPPTAVPAPGAEVPHGACLPAVKWGLCRSPARPQGVNGGRQAGDPTTTGPPLLFQSQAALSAPVLAWAPPWAHSPSPRTPGDARTGPAPHPPSLSLCHTLSGCSQSGPGDRSAGEPLPPGFWDAPAL